MARLRTCAAAPAAAAPEAAAPAEGAAAGAARSSPAPAVPGDPVEAVGCASSAAATAPASPLAVSQADSPLLALPWAETRTLLLQLREELQQRGYGGLGALNLELWVRHYLRCVLPGTKRRLLPAEIDPYLEHLRSSHGATAVQLAEARLALALLHGAVLEQAL